MSKLYERIEALCKQRGVSVTTMCRESGIPRANLTELKMGRQRTLGATTITKLCAFFGISADELLELNGKSPRVEFDNGGDDAFMDQMKFALFGGGGEITDEMFEEVKSFARYVVQRNKAANGKK